MFGALIGAGDTAAGADEEAGGRISVACVGGDPGCRVRVSGFCVCKRVINCWIRFCFSAALKDCAKATVISPSAVVSVTPLAVGCDVTVALV